ncbi:MAG: sensor histidine kinase [Robiginitomaculum sp.]|nr:MAG: sensor histidine kinase [Robiginitomaculum sp.]
MINSLSGRFLILTTVFVMLAEIMIFVPSVARFRADYLMERLERAQLASLALLADDMLDYDLERELLTNADVFNVVLRRDEVRQLALSSPIPSPIVATYDMRDPTAMQLIGEAFAQLREPEDQVIRVIGHPVADGGLLIEVTMATAPLRSAMLDYGLRILLLSAVISVITAVMLFIAVRILLVRPMEGVVSHIKSYAAAPEDARTIIVPSASVTELRAAEEALLSMQTELTGALRQKERLAQLGGAVAKISHDLRNILTTTQLFADRIETSQDPLVQRMLPKLLGSIGRAVNLCETTLAFGRAEEPPPALTRVLLAGIVADVLDSERLAAGDFALSFAEDIPAGMILRADGEQLFRVISNLVRNARQAIIAGDKPGEITISACEDDIAWWVSVIDTGPGLPKRAREDLFQPFNAGARKGGSGLGLVISAELIRGHGGRLELKRSDKTGTEFVICLPKAELNIAQAAE